MDGAGFMETVFWTFDAFAIYTDYFFVDGFVFQSANPFHKHFLEKFGADIGENTIDGVVRGYPIGQQQKAF